MIVVTYLKHLLNHRRGLWGNVRPDPGRPLGKRRWLTALTPSDAVVNLSPDFS